MDGAEHAAWSGKSSLFCTAALPLTPPPSCPVLQITFVIFHWIKGNPDFSTQGEYAADTLYEQIDAETAWTWNKKFLMLVPTVL